ncbi:Zinc finger HIT domain-containing protein 2 [Yarrowia sp. B02]|nr:Zinc finger HIT domain-containing protein 2 [Yarrowia sp. B02]
MLKPSTNASSLSAESHSCAFCSNPSNYSCPKCNSLYCSLACYKGDKHLFCSEKFYKSNVAEEQAFRSSNRMNPELQADRKKVLDIVDRYSEEQDGWKYQVPQGVDTDKIRQELEEPWSREEEQELNELLEKVPEDELWKLLSKEDQEKFLQFAKVSGA